MRSSSRRSGYADVAWVPAYAGTTTLVDSNVAPAKAGVHGFPLSRERQMKCGVETRMKCGVESQRHVKARSAASVRAVSFAETPQWSMRPGGHFQSSGLPTR